MKRRWQRVALGVSLCPFWWQWGNVSVWSDQKLWAFGPLRFGFRGWR